MKTTQHTTMICLFHSPDQAEDAVNDLVNTGISRDSIGVMANSGTAAANPVAMEKWKVPAGDAKLLTDGIRNGGVVVAVSALDTVADKVEEIFTRHKATQIDETVTAPSEAPLAAAAALPAAQGQIDVIEEELTVGKRQVQRGGVRVYQRIIEKAASEAISLREEHVSVERHAVNRPVTSVDAAFADQVIEMTATGEEPVVSKRARVVEEIIVGRESSERTETVKDTVRKTEVQVEEIEAGTKDKALRK